MYNPSRKSIEAKHLADIKQARTAGKKLVNSQVKSRVVPADEAQVTTGADGMSRLVPTGRDIASRAASKKK